MKSTKTVLSNPCSENWENMVLDENGRFCGRCNKTVVDFTDWSDEDIKKYFKGEQGGICGYFNESQVVIKRKWHHEFLFNLHSRIENNFRIPVLKTIALKLIVMSMIAAGCNSTSSLNKNSETNDHKSVFKGLNLHRNKPKHLMGHVAFPVKDSSSLWD